MPLVRLERRPDRADDHPAPPDALVAVRQPRAAQRTVSADDRLAALGLRTLADLLAPASVVIASDHLLLDGEYTRVLAVSAFPPLVAARWLNGGVGGAN